MSAPTLDCLVIGGGPAGLTAAIYLARFHLSVVVVDAGNSRAATIPLTRNHAGYPGGIAGAELVVRMRTQALEYGATIVPGEVVALARDVDLFHADTTDTSFVARTVLLATGVRNHQPPMAAEAHAAALAAGALRYCPVCDGYEVTDRRIAVLGTGERGTTEALFLRGFTADITLIAPDGPHALSDAHRHDLADGGIVLRDGPATGYALVEGGLALDTPAGHATFASLYPALGSDIHSALARMVGAEMTDDGCMTVDPHQRTSVDGLYAAGDVVLGLDQISHAMGEGGVAATTIRNDLAKRAPIRR